MMATKQLELKFVLSPDGSEAFFDWVVVEAGVLGVLKETD